MLETCPPASSLRRWPPEHEWSRRLTTCSCQIWRRIRLSTGRDGLHLFRQTMTARRSRFKPCSKTVAILSLILETYVMEVSSSKQVALSRAGIFWREENIINESHSSDGLRQSGSEPKDGRSFGTKRAVCGPGPRAHGICADCLQRPPFGARSVPITAKASCCQWTCRCRN